LQSIAKHAQYDIYPPRKVESYLLVEYPIVLVDVSDIAFFFVEPLAREFALLVDTKPAST